MGAARDNKTRSRKARAQMARRLEFSVYSPCLAFVFAHTCVYINAHVRPPAAKAGWVTGDRRCLDCNCERALNESVPFVWPPVNLFRKGFRTLSISGACLFAIAKQIAAHYFVSRDRTAFLLDHQIEFLLGLYSSKILFKIIIQNSD